MRTTFLVSSLIGFIRGQQPELIRADSLVEVEQSENFCKGTKEFMVSDHGANWHDAKEFCQSKGMELATIHSQEEQEAATATISARYMADTWIGLTRLEDEDHWYWSDGSQVNYENWKDPSNPLDRTVAGDGELDNDWKCVANGFGNFDDS